MLEGVRSALGALLLSATCGPPRPPRPALHRPCRADL